MSKPAQSKTFSRAFTLVVVVLVGILAAEAFLLLHKPKRPAQAANAIRAGAKQSEETFGNASAPIKIEFYAPLVLPWHQKTIGLLRQYAKKHPGRIFVKLMPMGNSECDDEMVKRGFTCAVIFINDKHEFTLPNGKHVDLQKQPNTKGASSYNSEDVITVIEDLTQ